MQKENNTKKNKIIKPKSEQVPLTWVFLAIGAILIMWLLSSWVYGA